MMCIGLTFRFLVAKVSSNNSIGFLIAWHTLEILVFHWLLLLSQVNYLTINHRLKTPGKVNIH